MATPQENLWPTPQPLMDEKTFAAKIKAKHPEYEGMDDADLTRRVLEKYPEYHESVQPAPPAGNVSSEDESASWPHISSGLFGTQQMDENGFAGKLRAKYPGVYDSLDDGELSRRVLNKYPEYRPHVRLSDAALRPSATSTINETADFSDETGPVKDYKPLALGDEDPSLAERIAGGAERLGGVEMLPAGHSANWHGRLTAVVPSPGHVPSQDQLADAMLAAMGPQAVEVGRRYRNETGRSIVLPQISTDKLVEHYDENAKAYKIPFNPTYRVSRVVDAYGRGGLQAAQMEVARMEEEDNALTAKQRAMKEQLDRELSRNPLTAGVALVSPSFSKGVADTALGTGRLINNARGFVRDPHESARDAEALESAQASIPEETTAGGKFVRGLTGTVLSSPRYMNPLGPVVATVENVHRGEEAAVKEGLKFSAAAGVGRGVGQYAEEAGLSPLERQVIARHAMGSTNALMNRVSGQDKSFLDSFLSYGQGAAFPVGKGKGRGERSTRPLADAPATSSMAGERVTHPVFGEIVVSADQSNVPPEMVRVQDESTLPPFLLRREVLNEGTKRSATPTRTTGERVLDLVNVPRATQTAGDVSAVGRQGLILSVLHPVKAAKNFARSLPTLFSEGQADKILNEIHSSPLAPVRKEAGLYLSDYHKSGLSITAGEEGFQSSIAQLIPGVRASERAYVTFLDKMRADAFDGYVKSHPDASPETLQGIASFINRATGRGDLGAWGEKHAQALSQAFYSPRYTLSRVQLPLEMFKGTSQSRAFAARSLVQFVGSGLAMMGLARAAGLKVGVDPLSSDFGSILVGHTRVNLWGGSSQIARYTAQLIMGQSRSIKDGELRSRSRMATAINFLRTRAAPQISVPLDTALGSDVTGQPATLSNLPKRTFLPLAWRDVEAAIKEDLRQGGSGFKGGAAGSLGLLGAGANTIEEGPGVSPNLVDERHRFNLPDSKSPAIENALSEIVTHPSYKEVPDDGARASVLRYVQHAATRDEADGLSAEAVAHNARVNAQVSALRSLITMEKSLTPAQREQLLHEVNSRFFYARVKPGDRRELSSVERVFSEQAKDSDKHLRERIAALRK